MFRTPLGCALLFLISFLFSLTAAGAFMLVSDLFAPKFGFLGYFGIYLIIGSVCLIILLGRDLNRLVRIYLPMYTAENNLVGDARRDTDTGTIIEGEDKQSYKIVKFMAEKDREYFLVELVEK